MAFQHVFPALRLVTAGLTACRTSPSPAGAPQPRGATSGQCHADNVQWALGNLATQDITGRGRRESHVGLIRVTAADQATLRDHKPDRIRVEVDAGNLIKRVYCG